MRATSIAATGMLAQQLNVEVISNNIANLNTNAFKAQRAEFQDLLYQDERAVGANSSDSGTIVPVGVQIGTGVKAAAVYRITTQGNLTQTSNPLDIAIQGHGYLPGADARWLTSYTRDGSLQLSPTGQLVTADGYTSSPAITIPQNTTSVTINANGQVMAQVAGQTAPQTVGQLELANFPNEAGLAATGQQPPHRDAGFGRRHDRQSRHHRLSARSSRASSRPRTSTSSRRSPTSSRRSAPTR